MTGKSSLHTQQKILGYPKPKHFVYPNESYHRLFSWQMDFRSKVDESCRTAEEFTKLYYESVDKKRHVSRKSLVEIDYKM